MHAFIDESKTREYVFGVVFVAPDRVHEVRKSVRTLLWGGQSRIHFVSESHRRRKDLLSVFLTLPVRPAVIFVEGESDPAVARSKCLSALIGIYGSQVSRWVFEQEDASLSHDRAALNRALRQGAMAEGTSYAHARPSTEPCLWIADAVAWSWSRGGEYRRRLQQSQGFRAISA